MLDQKLIDSEYGFLGDDIFLNISQVVLPPVRVQEAYCGFMKDYVASFGEGVVDKAWDIVADCRVKVAALINAEHDHEIGFVKNTAEGMSILASGLKLSSDDSVIIADQEHQSTLFPWINRHEKDGVKLKVIQSVDGEIDEDAMIAAIDDSTRVMVVSSAQFSTGFRVKLDKLGAACRERGVIFAVDGIQTIGRYVMDVRRFGIDYLVAGSNKGLLGTLGCGFIYCSDSLVRDIIPPYAGYQSVVSHVAPPSITTNFEHLEWYDNARRFESGNLSYNCILAVAKGVSLLLELGVDEIEARIRELETYLRDRIRDLKLHVVEARDPENRSGIICVYYPPDKEAQVVDTLRSYKIHCTMRGGYIRLGIGFYNTFAQMDAAAEALHKIETL